MIQVKVFGVAVDPVTKGFVVILKDNDEKKVVADMDRAIRS